MHRRFIAFILLILLVILSSCAKKPGPTKKPARPKIPEKINQGAEKEPILTVYDIQANTTKQMKLEEYVAGVVAGEMENNWPVEALAAQAILARTYVLDFIAEKGGSKYGNAHISTDFEEAQAWNPPKINDNIRKAVEITRGEVVTYNGKYVKAWFHSHAGGMTATAKEGLNYKDKEPPYIKVVKSPDADAGPSGKKTWSASFSKEELSSVLKNKMGVNPDPIDTVMVAKRGPSGRASLLKVGKVTVSAPELRIALGSMDMRSTLLTSFRVEGDKVIMSGKGFGHGVGLSQWGAHVMAKQGKKHVEIINHYFKNVDIVKLWK